MSEVTLTDVQLLWPTWGPAERNRFMVSVLGFKGSDTDPLSNDQFLCMAVDRWFAYVLDQFNESVRHWFVRSMYQEGEEKVFPDYPALTKTADGTLPAFFVSVFDARWATHTGTHKFLDLLTFDTVTKLPRQHTWSIILGVTPMYYHLISDLERTDAASSNQTP